MAVSPNELQDQIACLEGQLKSMNSRLDNVEISQLACRDKADRLLKSSVPDELAVIKQKYEALYLDHIELKHRLREIKDHECKKHKSVLKTSLLGKLTGNADIESHNCKECPLRNEEWWNERGDQWCNYGCSLDDNYLLNDLKGEDRKW